MKVRFISVFFIVMALPAFGYNSYNNNQNYSCVDIETGEVCNVIEQNNLITTRKITKRTCLVQTNQGLQCYSVFYPGYPSTFVSSFATECIRVTGKWFLETCGK